MDIRVLIVVCFQSDAPFYRFICWLLDISAGSIIVYIDDTSPTGAPIAVPVQRTVGAQFQLRSTS